MIRQCIDSRAAVVSWGNHCADEYIFATFAPNRSTLSFDPIPRLMVLSFDDPLLEWRPALSD